MDLMIEDLMEQLVQGGGSDLHLATGQPPYGRFSGELRPMTDRPLAEEDCNKLIFSRWSRPGNWTAPTACCTLPRERLPPERQLCRLPAGPWQRFPALNC